MAPMPAPPGIRGPTSDERRKENLFLVFLIGGLFIFLITSFFVFRPNAPQFNETSVSSVVHHTQKLPALIAKTIREEHRGIDNYDPSSKALRIEYLMRLRASIDKMLEAAQRDENTDPR